MKRQGILNSGLSGVVARLGHGDMLLIGDVGCAFPEKDIPVIDLAVSEGIPTVADVLGPILEELVVERYILAEEALTASPNAIRVLDDLVLSGSTGISIERQILPHAQIKKLWLNGEQMRAFVRTGEYTPWGYIILVAGVSF